MISNHFATGGTLIKEVRRIEGAPIQHRAQKEVSSKKGGKCVPGLRGGNRRAAWERASQGRLTEEGRKGTRTAPLSRAGPKIRRASNRREGF